jgi:hypothetical protein
MQYVYTNPKTKTITTVATGHPIACVMTVTTVTPLSLYHGNHCHPDRPSLSPLLALTPLSDSLSTLFTTSLMATHTTDTQNGEHSMVGTACLAIMFCLNIS